MVYLCLDIVKIDLVSKGSDIVGQDIETMLDGILYLVKVSFMLFFEGKWRTLRDLTVILRVNSLTEKVTWSQIILAVVPRNIPATLEFTAHWIGILTYNDFLPLICLPFDAVRNRQIALIMVIGSIVNDRLAKFIRLIWKNSETWFRLTDYILEAYLANRNLIKIYRTLIDKGTVKDCGIARCLILDISNYNRRMYFFIFIPDVLLVE